MTKNFFFSELIVVSGVRYVGFQMTVIFIITVIEQSFVFDFGHRVFKNDNKSFVPTVTQLVFLFFQRVKVNCFRQCYLEL